MALQPGQTLFIIHVNSSAKRAPLKQYTVAWFRDTLFAVQVTLCGAPFLCYLWTNRTNESIIKSVCSSLPFRPLFVSETVQHNYVIFETKHSEQDLLGEFNFDLYWSNMSVRFRLYVNFNSDAFFFPKRHSPYKISVSDKIWMSLKRIILFYVVFDIVSILQNTMKNELCITCFRTRGFLGAYAMIQS